MSINWQNIQNSCKTHFDNGVQFLKGEWESTKHNFNRCSTSKKALIIASAILGAVVSLPVSPLILAGGLLAGYVCAKYDGEIVNKVKDFWNNSHWAAQTAMIIGGGVACVMLPPLFSAAAGMGIGHVLGEKPEQA